MMSVMELAYMTLCTCQIYAKNIKNTLHTKREICGV